MSAIESVVGPGLFVTATNSGATTTATVQAGSGQTLYIDGILISAAAAPGGTVEVSVSGLAASMPIEIPASAFAPMYLSFNTRPLPANPSQNVVVSIPTLGAVKCAITVFYHYGP